jgi:hypothetical protein
MSYSNWKLREAAEEWDREVEEEAIRLIREGTPPFQATLEATEIVTRRRRSAALVEKYKQKGLT